MKLLKELSKLRVHEDGPDCQCAECIEYAYAIYYVEDDMSEEAAILAIVEGAKISVKKARDYVEGLLDMGFLECTDQRRKEILGKSQVIEFSEQKLL